MFSHVDGKTVARWVKDGLKQTDPNELAKLSPQKAGFHPSSIENAVERRLERTGAQAGKRI
jgi:hypothetical protein